MIKQLTRNGNSLALVLDKALLELIHVDADAPVVELSVDGDHLIVRAATPEKVRDLQEHKRKLREAMEWTNRTHAETFKKLAE